MNTTVSNKKILVLGASTKSAVFVTNQYKKYGLHTTVIDWLNIPIRHSQYIDRYLDIGNPEKNVLVYVDKLLAHIESENYLCILPIHDLSLEICQKYYNVISKKCQIIGINHPDIHEYAHNKWKLIEVASRIGITCPKSVLISNLNMLNDCINNIQFPCIAKPASSAVIVNNKLLSFKVKKINTKIGLIDFVREHINNVDIIVQEFVEGYGIGYNLIAKNGKIFNAYIHKRIHEKNGVSSYRESLSIENFKIKNKVEALIKEIGWNGVAMVEFKMQNATPVLMEINGRFWGSIELGIKSGLNYPVQLFEMDVLKKNIERNINYKCIRVRNFHDEFVHYFGNLLIHGRFSQFFKWVYSLKNIFSSKEFIEDNLFDNFGFVFGLYWNDLKRIFKRTRAKLLSNILPFKRNILKIDKYKKQKIAFVCKGNICRSPFSELYARKIAPENEYFSFGIVATENRCPPVHAVEAGTDFDVDLENFRSTSLTAEVLNEMDIIIVMDKINYYDLRKMDIVASKIFFLGKNNISDPYSKNIEFYKNVYKQIATLMNVAFKK